MGKQPTFSERIAQAAITWGGPLLIVAGIVLAGASFVISDSKQGLAVTSLVLGVALVALGVLLPRLEGPFQVGPSGLKAVLAQITEGVKEAAEEKHLTTEEAVEAVERAVEQIVSVSMIANPPKVFAPEVVQRAVSHGVDVVIVKRASDTMDISLEERAHVERFDDEGTP